MADDKQAQLHAISVPQLQLTGRLDAAIRQICVDEGVSLADAISAMALLSAQYTDMITGTIQAKNRAKPPDIVVPSLKFPQNGGRLK